MINAITPNAYYYNRTVKNRSNTPSFRGRNTNSSLISQKSSHSCEMCGRKSLNWFTGLFNKKFVDQANEILSKIDRSAPLYTLAVANAGRVFSQNKVVEINDDENDNMKKLAESKIPHIFIMNHDNQISDPQMLGFFNTLLSEEYILSDKAETCPRPRIILNEDILLSMNSKMRNIFEKLGAIGIDASLSSGNKAANGKKMVQLMKEYANGESNIYIFPEGKNCAYKNLPLKERFQPGIAALIERLLKKTDVSVVPLGFAYNESNKSLCSIQIGEPVVFEKDKINYKTDIFNSICSALETQVTEARAKVPQKSLSEEVIYV